LLAPNENYRDTGSNAEVFMDTSTIAGAALAMRSAQTQQALSISMMKMAAGQQNRIADLLAQSVQQAPQPAVQGDYNFSIYA
jgi:hypothetical protein